VEYLEYKESKYLSYKIIQFDIKIALELILSINKAIKTD